MPDLTHEQLAALAAAGASNREIETAHGRPMTDDERAAVDRARLATRIRRIINRPIFSEDARDEA
jgi:hypothetical protein